MNRDHFTSFLIWMLLRGLLIAPSGIRRGKVYERKEARDLCMAEPVCSVFSDTLGTKPGELLTTSRQVGKCWVLPIPEDVTRKLPAPPAEGPPRVRGCVP